MSKLALIVGCGNKGIGEACVKKFLSENYKVAFLGRTKSKLDEIESRCVGSKGYVCDVGDGDAVETTLSLIKMDMGPVHTLIYNATAGAFNNFDATSIEDFEQRFSSGPTGLFRLSKLLLPDMLASNDATGINGVIGVTGATASWRGMPSTPGFAPHKFAMRALTQSLARTYASAGIHVFHAVIDGMVDLPTSRAFMPNKPDAEWISPDNCALAYYQHATAPPGAWCSEFNLFAYGAGESHLNI